jgi:hypothetical protein
VGRLARGSSSLLGRIEKAPHRGAFLWAWIGRCFRPVVDVLLLHDKYVHSVRPSGARDNGLDVSMSASFHRGGWEVRWRDASGRRRARRSVSEERPAPSTKRGFSSERAALAARRRLIEQVERGEVRIPRRPSVGTGNDGSPGGAVPGTRDIDGLRDRRSQTR